jgi:CubicO group peptidase (beta-lactamase class C family)
VLRPILFFALALGHTSAATGQATCTFPVAEARFQSLINAAGLSGGGFLVGGRHGVYRERYFGSSNAQTVELIASASKLLAGLRLLQLAERGAVSLDAPVRTVLPQFSGPKGEMTVRQMFAHTAGYGDDSGSAVLLNPNLTLAQAVDQIACCRPLNTGYSVGGQFSYGGVSMHIAGRVAEVGGNSDWNLGWQNELGQPLGSPSISWSNGISTNYGIAGTARSNLRDYGRVLQMLTNYGRAPGRRVLKASTVAILQQDAVGSLPIAYAPPNVSSPVRYSFGAWLQPIPNRPASEPAVLHSLGAFGFFPWIDYATRTFGIFMIRGETGINSVALPVYLDMLADIEPVVRQNQCALLEPNEEIFVDGME